MSSQNYFAYNPHCSVWVDDCVVLRKANGEDEPQPTARIVGIVSAGGRDFDGDDIVQEGIDWDPFLTQGWINYEHQTGPDNIMGYGESVSPAKDSDGNPATRLVAHLLLNKQKARETYETAVALQKSGSGRQIGFSLEGAARLRDPRNPKRVLKSFVRHVAITASPKRYTARLELVKSFSSPDELADFYKSESGVGTVGYQTPGTMAGGEGSLSALLTQSIDRGTARVVKDYAIKDLRELIKSRFPLLIDPHLQKAAEAFKEYLKLRF